VKNNEQQVMLNQQQVMLNQQHLMQNEILLIMKDLKMGRDTFATPRKRTRPATGGEVHGSAVRNEQDHQTPTDLGPVFHSAVLPEHRKINPVFDRAIAAIPTVKLENYCLQWSITKFLVESVK
jgi:hypothetical protein